jgi:hypothetical protein
MIAALRAAETKTERSGGAGRKGDWGEACLPAGREFLPALACPSEAERRWLLLNFGDYCIMKLVD